MKRKSKMSKEINRSKEKCCSTIPSDTTLLTVTPGHETVLPGLISQVEYYG